MTPMPSRRIWGAVVVGLFLVVGAYLHTSAQAAKQEIAIANAQAAALRAPIRTVDSDSNGLEDWKEALIKSEPLNLPGGSDEEYERPTTLTGQFSIGLAENIIAAKGTQGIGRSSDQVISDVVENTLRQIPVTVYTFDDLVVVETTADTATYYLNTAAVIVIAANLREENEAVILKQSLEEQNPQLLDTIADSVASYQSIIDQLLNLPVPDTLAPAHLELINSFESLRADMEAMTMAYSDPLYTLVRIQRYSYNLNRLRQAFGDMSSKMQTAPGTIEPTTDPAAFFFFMTPEGQRWLATQQ